MNQNDCVLSLSPCFIRGGDGRKGGREEGRREGQRK